MSDHDNMAIIPGARIRLKCEDPDCFVGDVEVTSKGGHPSHPPTCPGCMQQMEPQGEIIAPTVESWED
jgi:hypothetical protein